MGAITKRATKGSALTTAELDTNFDNAWSSIKLTSDYVGATTTQTTITDGTTAWSWTPPANTDIEIEAELLVLATATANLPSVQAVVPGAANNTQYGWAEVAYYTALTTRAVVGVSFTTAGGSATVPAGTAINATAPIRYCVQIKVRTGSSPAAITIKAAGESAAAAAVTVKAGSVMRYRTVT
jgi:hypothetical protein